MVGLARELTQRRSWYDLSLLSHARKKSQYAAEKLQELTSGRLAGGSFRCPTTTVPGAGGTNQASIQNSYRVCAQPEPSRCHPARPDPTVGTAVTPFCHPLRRAGSSTAMAHGDALYSTVMQAGGAALLAVGRKFLATLGVLHPWGCLT